MLEQEQLLDDPALLSVIGGVGWPPNALAIKLIYTRSDGRDTSHGA
jgi:hypothetical protein